MERRNPFLVSIAAAALLGGAPRASRDRSNDESRKPSKTKAVLKRRAANKRARKQRKSQ